MRAPSRRRSRRWRAANPASLLSRASTSLEDAFIHFMSLGAGEDLRAADPAFLAARTWARSSPRNSSRSGATALTFAMMLLIPIMQLILFGYAINTDPEAGWTPRFSATGQAAIRAPSSRPRTRHLLSLRRSGRARGRSEGLLRQRQGSSSSYDHPQDFGARIVRGDKPELLIGPTRPTRRGERRARRLESRRASALLTISGPLAEAQAAEAPLIHLTINVHRRYNPEGFSQYNIVPGLMGVVLHDDDGHDDGARPDARTRARHDGKPAGDARQRPSRSCPARSCRTSPSGRPGRGHPRRGATFLFRRSRSWAPAGCCYGDPDLLHRARCSAIRSRPGAATRCRRCR